MAVSDDDGADQFHHQRMLASRVRVAGAAVFIVLAVPGFLILPGFGPGGVAVLLSIIFVGLASVIAAVVTGDQLGFSFEMWWRSHFREVCRRKGLAVKDDAGRWVYPRYDRLAGSGRAFRVRIFPLGGQSLADYEKAGASLGLALGSLSIRVDDAGDGTILLKAGTEQMASRSVQPETVERVALEHVGQTWRQQLATVVIGATDRSKPYGLPLIDSHVLIAGQTGAGKGSVIWSIVLGLVPYVRADVVRLWGFDPKRMELSLGEAIFGDRYAATPDAMVEMLERAHDEMQERADKLRGRSRKFEPSPDMPLNVLVIDELGYLAALLSDRKVQQRVERALTGILVLGRAAGFVVIGALQDPRKSTLDFRDLFPTRVAMRLTRGMVDLVLGAGMYEAGAHCDLIPAGPAGAGVAYVLAENATEPQVIRATWCSDDSIIAAARLFDEPDAAA